MTVHIFPDRRLGPNLPDRHQIDLVVGSIDDRIIVQVSPVPEPSTWAMMVGVCRPWLLCLSAKEDRSANGHFGLIGALTADPMDGRPTITAGRKKMGSLIGCQMFIDPRPSDLRSKKSRPRRPFRRS